MQLLFYILAAISVISAVAVVSSRSPMNSVIALVVCFLSIAGHYVLLNAQFLAMVHIIVYTGAIMVLFLFVIMLLNLNRAAEPMKTLGTRVVAVLAGGLLFVTLLAALRHGIEARAANAYDPTVGLVKSVGMSLYTEFLLPFEVSSVLFLSAVVGVVLLAGKERPWTPPTMEPTETEGARGE
ncbi:MAG: NADH-quinone oxidoreductase subunit J [Flavobacteriales bacterium]|jgi:NADH-quinone oxidoreductase subunit J|nr:NADH-quinone oxidoreductase subunit J [Flavobacteriales bacterium]